MFDCITQTVLQLVLWTGNKYTYTNREMHTEQSKDEPFVIL